MVGLFVGRSFGLNALLFGAILTGVFLVVAIWSAWQRVAPLAGLKPLSDRQLMLTLISQVTGSMVYFSPRHATAGAALILIGGPAGIIEAFGIWAHRLRVDTALIEEAASLLASCQTKFPAEQVRVPTAALLLKRLALIKFLPRGDSAVLALTEKGVAILSGDSRRKMKARTAHPSGDSP